jgi:hypothetical protein
LERVTSSGNDRRKYWIDHLWGRLDGSKLPSARPGTDTSGALATLLASTNLAPGFAYR